MSTFDVCTVHGSVCPGGCEEELAVRNRKHEWIENKTTFVIEADEEDPSYSAPLLAQSGRATRRTWGVEAVLAREILRGRIEATELTSENDRLTDRVNALTAQIEKALDLMLSGTESSHKIAEAYRKLEKVLLEKVK